MLSENLTGLARIVRAAAVPALENVALWHERDISHSSVERVIGPDATLALDFALMRLAGMMDKLVVHPGRMLANLESLGGVVHSGEVLLALTRAGILREAAACGCEGPVSVRGGPQTPFVTDGGHFILDCLFGRIPDADTLAARLLAIPGVVEHGLFLGIATAVISAGPEGVTILGHPEAR